MTYPALRYPALYNAADVQSAWSQRFYFTLLRLEYFCLFAASIFSLNTTANVLPNLLYAGVFLLALILLVYRETLKPEQGWYKGRALAESVKTSSWRFCMRAAPFEDAPDVRVPKREFRKHLGEILKANRHVLGEKLPPHSADGPQITESMEQIRAMSLAGRKEIYAGSRIAEQRAWYALKAKENKRKSKWWQAACITVYGLSVAFVLGKVVFSSWTLWPVEPLIVIASSIIGWMQIKRFNELASSYTLTAHEIGILQSRINEFDSEADFSEFVNEAELAFSREHTHWVARQTA